LSGLYAHSLLFNNLKGISRVTSYIAPVTLAVFKEYAPELAPMPHFLPYLTDSNFS